MDPPVPLSSRPPIETWVSDLLRAQHHRCALCSAAFTIYRPHHADFSNPLSQRMLCMPCVRVLRLAGTDPSRFPATVVELETVLRDAFDMAYCRAGPYATGTKLARSPHKIVVAFYRAAKRGTKARAEHDAIARAAQDELWRNTHARADANLMAAFQAGTLRGYQLCGRCNVPKPTPEFRDRRNQVGKGVLDHPCKSCERQSNPPFNPATVG